MDRDQIGSFAVIENVLGRYRDYISVAGERLQESADRSGEAAEPDFVPPRVDGPWLDYFSASKIAIRSPESLGITVLDMMQGPETRTTKIIGSLLIVARAISHYERTGERVALVTPSSGNKVTALRNAVSRAYRHSLATTDTLRIISVVPAVSAYKVRHCDIAEDAQESARNPIFVRDCEPPDQVRAEVQSVIGGLADMIRKRSGWRLWNTSNVRNYAHGDCVRAFLEDEFLPARPTPRWHVQAVSSGFGLLGYNLGYETLAAPNVPHGVFLLVQQLAAPGLVRGLASAYETDPVALPVYQEQHGAFMQTANPHFPPVVTDLEEVIDPTFYARNPATRAAVHNLLQQHGGDGIVVSKAECLLHYAYIRKNLASAGLDLPLDPYDLREWSTIIAMTGLLLARERGLMPGDVEVVLHATGLYSDSTLRPADPTTLITVVNARGLAQQIEDLLAA